LASASAILGQLFLHGVVERFLYKRRHRNEYPLLTRHGIIGNGATRL
jgi:hypothetical protein